MTRATNGGGSDMLSMTTAEDRYQLQPRLSQRRTTLALRSSISRKPSKTPSKQLQQAPVILQRRDHLRIYEDGEDVTPRNLFHPDFHPLDERVTAFDLMNHMFSQSGINLAEMPRSSLSRLSSFSSIFTEDEAAFAGRRSSLDSGLGVNQSAAGDLEEAPSQFPLPK